ncbi:MAG TPA: glycine cleavage system aminomethyltransferase GcvT [Kiritimatiellae bacterium]|nr:glycine cleavage system aminomethyltransferase GcvT [Kiritimatiellia bacterium]
MKETPLHKEHIALHAHMTEFGGWDMPLFYAGIVVEHLHTRTACSLFDTCHMGELELSGSTAAADLERIFTRRISQLPPGACRYGYLLNPEGGVIDDLTCYRLGDDRFLLVVNAGTANRDAVWITEHLSPQTTFRDISSQTAKLDLQGPHARQSLEQVFGLKLPELPFYRAVYVELDGTRCLLSRSGYTGEMGYEIYLPAEAAAILWRRLLSGETVAPAGLGARDTLRLEMGYPLYGHELTTERRPTGIAGGRFLDLDKDFIGRDAVVREIEQGPRENLIGIILSGRRTARSGDVVLEGDRPVGAVTSGSFAPSVGKAVALAYVHRDVAQPGRRVEVRTRRARLEGILAQPPFLNKKS